LLDAILGHPRLAGVELALSCEADMVPFYERWGFEDAAGRSVLMRRTAR
jgi:hypothetical protein